MYPNGHPPGFSGAAGFEQRLSEVVGILCGTPHDEGLIHVTRRTAETVDRLGDGLARMERAITDLANESRSAISDVREAAKTQATRLATLETQRDGVRDKFTTSLLELAWWTASKGFFVIVAAAAIVWLYLSAPHAGVASLTLPTQQTENHK